MIDYRPQTLEPKVEWHITYRCNLTCPACTRASFLKPSLSHTPNMTIEDAVEFIRQANELKWRPRVIIIGGEPTMHPQFKEFCLLAKDWTRSFPVNFVQVFSNGHSEATRKLLFEMRDKHDISLCTDEWKPEGSMTGQEKHWDMGTFVSPMDAGVGYSGDCYQHARQICGVGVDHDGYALCPTGLSIVKVLGMKEGIGYTKRLADLFDPVKAEAMTQAMCTHCGFCMRQRGTEEKREKFKAYAKTLPIKHGSPMSPTWVRAFERIEARSK